MHARRALHVAAHHLTLDHEDHVVAVVTVLVDHHARIPAGVEAQAVRRELEPLLEDRGSALADLEPGLATDALAHWLLSELEAERSPWEPLRDLCADEDQTLYSRLIDEQRTNQGLHNDDTTLLQVEVD